jgi:hypothetical protein
LGILVKYLLIFFALNWLRPIFLHTFDTNNNYNSKFKLIGATCHYVTSELDEGPIIEQDVLRVSHSDSELFYYYKLTHGLQDGIATL